MNQTDLFWSDLRRRIEATGDYEDRLEILRIFTKTVRQDILRRDLGGDLPLPALFEEISSLAEAALLGSHAIARDQLRASGLEPSEGFAVVAMGKFGGRELTYHSDLDVIFFYQYGEEQEATTRLAQRIITALTVHTRNGTAFQIDAALRPSGNSGALVTSLDSFRDYHRTVGRAWERQALLRARPVVGPPEFLQTLQEEFARISFVQTDSKDLAREIRHLRERMEREIAKERPGHYNLKTGIGGLVDVEFAVQFLELVHGRDNANLREANTISALRNLASAGIVAPALAKEMESSYLFLREVETRLRLVLDQPTDELIEGREAWQELERRFFKPLLPGLQEARKKIRDAYETILPGE